MSAWAYLFSHLAVFPLHTIEPGPRCGCGNPDCTDIGKHPAVPWGDIQPAQKLAKARPGAGYGIATGSRSGIFVVDCDGDSGLAAFAALGSCPDTFTVRRGPGRHFYFRHPDFKVSNSRSLLAPHVDIRGDGGYIVAPGSPHKSGDKYEIALDAPVAEAPDWLLDWLYDRSAPDVAVHEYEGDVEGEDLVYHTDIYRAYLRTAPPCIAKSGGDAQLWHVVQRGALDLALPANVVLESIREIYDPRCIPPWGADLDRRVMHKIRCAKEQSTRAPIPPLPRALLAPGVAPWPIDESLAAPALAPAEAISEVEYMSPDNPELAALEAELKITWGEWDKEIPPPTYIVQDVIPNDTVGMIVAKGSSLKTWMALSIGIAVAVGSPWLGKFEVQQGNVLIVDFESGEWQLKHRAKQLGAGSTPGLGHASFPNARIDDAKFWNNLAKICKGRSVSLVIIDSFAAGAPGVDENVSAAAMPLDFAGRFSNVTGASVLMIHHAKKGEGGDERDLIRGTGAIYASVDWAVTMIPLDDNRTRMKVRNIKPWGPRPEDFQVELVDGQLVLDVEVETSPQEEGEDIKSKIRAALSHGPVANQALLAKAIRKSKGETGDYLKALEATREVVNIPGFGYQLDNPKARWERVRKTLGKVLCSTLPQAAKIACVSEDELVRWQAERRIFKSAEGRLMAED